MKKTKCYEIMKTKRASAAGIDVVRRRQTGQ